MTFHTTNLGSFSGGVPRDQDGYAHTDARSWAKARMDWSGYDYASKMDRCRELAAQTREATRKAEKSLAEWRARN